jgi:sterol desaturase/sphingolipid hydroxylase (fatty acid hydroxylase superfamily)
MSAPRDLPGTLAEAVAEFYRHGSPRLLTGLALGAVVARPFAGGVSGWDLGLPLLIVALWPLQEWLIHVFILHYRPRRLLGRTLDFEVPRLHRAHHREPWQLGLIFIPIHVFLYVPLVLLGVFLWAGGLVGFALSGVAVYFALSLHYEWVHFLIHTRVKPESRYYQRLWRNHRLHHFKNEHYWYGVTMLGGDRWFGTAPPRDSVPTSPTARDLGLEASPLEGG